MKTPNFILILSFIALSVYVVCVGYVGQPNLIAAQTKPSDQLSSGSNKDSTRDFPARNLSATASSVATASSMTTGTDNRDADIFPAADIDVHYQSSRDKLKPETDTQLSPLGQPNQLHQLGLLRETSALTSSDERENNPVNGVSTIDIHTQLMRWQRFIDGTELQQEELQLISHILKNAEVANSLLYSRVIERSISKQAFSSQRAELISNTEAELGFYLGENEMREFRRVWQDNSAQYPATISTRLNLGVPAKRLRLFELATGNSSTELENLLRENAIDVNAVDPRNGSNALIKASYAGKTENVVTLLSHGATVHGRTRYGRTALLNAVSNGHDKTVAILLAAGADATQRDHLGLSVLNVADLYKSMGDNYEKIATMISRAVAAQESSAIDVVVSLR